MSQSLLYLSNEKFKLRHFPFRPKIFHNYLQLAPHPLPMLWACLTSRNPLSLHLYSHIFRSCQNHIKHTVPVTKGCQCLARCFSQSFIKPYNPSWPCQFIKLPIFPHERSPPARVYKCLHPRPFSGETNFKSFIWRPMHFNFCSFWFECD